MTQEEKAKAYDEAIERLRNAFYDNSGRMCEEYRKAVIKIIEPIFPQLKESEDEKIRKWIREELKSKYVVDNIVNDVMADKALAWLEERGEQKSAWSDEDENIRQWITHDIDKLLALKKKSFIIADKEINWLKSLRPQSQWKQSNEHYELEEFAKIVRCNLTGISKAVQELFEAKYLQLTGNKMYEGFKD